MSGQTVRLTITRNDEEDVILTGTSYKYWWEQAVEYIFRNYGNREHGWRYSDIDDLHIEVERSLSKWKGWGGLKWCSPKYMQEELNREGVQQDEPDNPNPRQFSKFKFEYYPIGYDKLKKELKRY